MFPDLLCDDVFRLETNRLWLRWPRAADAAQIARLAGDRDVATKTARIPHPYPEGAAAEFILTSRSANARGESLTLTLALTKKRQPGELIGCISLTPKDDGALELGYWLGQPYWGRGLMSEAAAEMVDLGFRWTDIDEMQASALPDNPASLRVLEKAGFAACGRGTCDAPARGGSLPCETRRMTREDWIDRGNVRPHRTCAGDCRVNI